VVGRAEATLGLCGAGQRDIRAREIILVREIFLSERYSCQATRARDKNGEKQQL
jgi:hypothetical protein